MALQKRTPVTITSIPEKLHYRAGILAMGSCFAEHMGRALEGRKFQVVQNPFGILFNPISIVGALTHMLSNEQYTEANLLFNDGLWYSFDHHGRFAHPDPAKAAEQINRELAVGRQMLLEGEWLLLTMGTAHVWLKKDTQAIVANCHRFPNELFQRERLGVEAVTDTLGEVITRCRQENPNLKVILTVSPVRYVRDGLVDSQRSKAALILAAEQLEQHFPFVHYFPAYELVTDELRDYSFFDRAGTHPNEDAVAFVWEKLADAWLEPETKAAMQRVAGIQRAAAHRPHHPASESHQAFLRKQLQEVVELESGLPFLDFREEKNQFLEQKL
jgi:hypothetical protein